MKSIIALAAALGIVAGSSVAFAQTADPHKHANPPPAAGQATPPADKPSAMAPAGPGKGMGMMQRMQMGKHTEGRLAFLRAEIGITEAQTPAWNAFADVVRKNSKGMMAMPMAPQAAQGSWLENLDRHEKMMAAHLDGLRAIRGSAQTLYAEFTDDQKRLANDLMAGPMGPMAGMHGMGGMASMMRM